MRRLGAVSAVAGLAVASILAWHFYSHRSHPPARPAVVDRSLSSPLNQPGGGNSPGDAYEVYSALYRAPLGEPLFIAEESVTDIPQVNGSCLQPSTAQEHEMTDAFVDANRQSHRWARNFAIPAAYRLLSRDEVSTAVSCIAGSRADAPGCGAYRDARHVRFLGVPGFSRDHSRALVSVIKSCGSDCGTGGIFVMERAGASWRRAELTAFTAECSWRY